MPFGPTVGCDRLSMAPVLTAEVTSDAAYSATGFDLDTTIPQTYENARGLATSTLNKEVVTLPEGMTVNPSSGVGLGACTEAQYAEELAPAKTAQEKAEGKGCPNDSKLATVKSNHRRSPKKSPAPPTSRRRMETRSPKPATRTARCSCSTSSPAPPTVACSSRLPARSNRTWKRGV